MGVLAPRSFKRLYGSRIQEFAFVHGRFSVRGVGPVAWGFFLWPSVADKNPAALRIFPLAQVRQFLAIETPSFFKDEKSFGVGVASQNS